MTKSPRKNVPGVGIELGAACMPSELASDRATAPGLKPGYPKDRIEVLRNSEIRDFFFFFFFFLTRLDKKMKIIFSA